MSIIQRKDRHNEWWVDFRLRGRRIRRKSPIQTLEGVLEFEQHLRCQPDDDSQEDELPLASSSNYKEFAERWLRDYVAVANRASTAEEKRRALNSRLLPAFGHIPLSQITTNTVDAQVAVWMRSGLGIKRINNLCTILRKSLRCAAEWGLIRQTPIIRHHKYFPPSPKFLTQTESDRLLATMEPGFWRTFVFFLLATGVRFGEAAALKWEDLRLEDTRPIVLIRRAVNAGIVSEPKTQAGRRAIALIPELVICLRALQCKRRDTEWVFTSPTGRFYRPGKCCHVLKRACEKASVPIVSWHKLRHSCATQLLGHGVPLIAIKELLGHTTIEVTSIYAHVAPTLAWEYMQFLSPQRHNLSPGGHQKTFSHFDDSNRRLVERRF